ncbi:hypothetical protein ACFW5I_33145 [Streptomyces sp. NPDC058818]|uniref:hypothetical protein n=1 Tax=Streptomyces sp. NPDC058818 TaxID=3346640 RepID=UPI00369BC96B
MVSASSPGPGLERWIEEGRATVLDIADMLGVSTDSYTSNPVKLVPYLQNYVSRLPLSDFEQSDWVTLHSDLLSYVADFLIRIHGARWVVVEDLAMPGGYRYVIEATGREGEVRRVDPADILANELKESPVEISRLLASAELTLQLVPHIAEDR